MAAISSASKALRIAVIGAGMSGILAAIRLREAGFPFTVIEKNKGDITRSIELLYKLSSNVNQTLIHVEKSKLFNTDLQALVNNLIQITKDTREITDNFGTPEGRRTIKLLHDLLWRLEPLDSVTIRDFMQKEGIRARVF